MSASDPPVDLRYAKSEDYRAVLEDILARGECPFCPNHLSTWHTKPILREEGGWLITESRWPYEQAAHHFLVIGGRHLEHLEDIAPSDLAAVHHLMAWAAQKFGIPGGALLLRFGNPLFSGATVRHLHFHLISPREGEVVQFPVG